MIDSLELKNLSLRVGAGVDLFQNIQALLPTQKIVWVRGSSGSGKSTFLKVLAGLISAQGEYLINGQNILQNSFEEFLPLRKKIGFY